VAFGCGGGIDGTAQLQLVDDTGGGHIADLAQQRSHLLVGDGAGAVAVNTQGNGLGNADGVGQLHLHLLGEACCYQVLGHVAGHVSGGAVHLGGVLAGEGTAAVGEITAVGVHNDLSAGQAGVAVGAADDEIAGGIDMDVGDIVDVKAVIAQHGGDDAFPDVAAQLAHFESGRVHDGNHHGIDAQHIAVFIVLNGYLGLAVGPQQVVGVDAGGQPIGKGAGQGDGQRHQLGGLGTGMELLLSNLFNR